jgi:DNA-binding winged helix-turn-helix (wHTH) protein
MWCCQRDSGSGNRRQPDRSVIVPLGQIVLAQEADFSLGALRICPSKREVLAGAARESLQPRIMQVFVALARRRGEVVSRDELVATCWGGYAVSDDAIHRCIARIRRLSEAHGGFRLETVPRVGYQLTEIEPAETSNGSFSSLNVARAATRTVVMIGGGLLLIAAGFLAAHL